MREFRVQFRKKFNFFCFLLSIDKNTDIVTVLCCTIFYVVETFDQKLFHAIEGNFFLQTNIAGKIGNENKRNSECKETKEEKSEKSDEEGPRFLKKLFATVYKNSQNSRNREHCAENESTNDSAALLKYSL